MTVLDCVLAALQSLRVNLMRSFLTALGIIIGVGAVITMVSIGAGAEARVQALIQNIGSNLIIVVPGATSASGVRLGRGSKKTLTEDDAIAIQNEISSVVVAGPSVRGSGQLIFGNLNWFTPLRGVNPAYLEAREWAVQSGRTISTEDVKAAAKVALLGTSVVEQLFPGQDPVGQIMRINRVPFTVIGVLQEKGQTPRGTDQDDIVQIPISTAKKRVIGGRKVKGRLVDDISIKAASAELVEDTENDVRDLLRQRHRLRIGQPDDFSIRNISEMLEARAESSRVMSMLLAAVAAVSLVVGGIGIMNIMLVSVTERTREIGLRLAIGARSRDILNQFLIESLTLAVAGGAIGLVAGVAASIGIAQMAGWPVLIRPDVVLLAIGFSAGVGVFFGYYPARKAANLDPIEALRYE
ncbi:MAG: ABC transporter permease [Rhodospirillales bacterium]|nr:ABC transporter permease [Rhodospirillales bacterium]